MSEKAKMIGAAALGIIALVLVINALLPDDGFDADSDDPKVRLAAVEGLRGHDSDAARETLRELTADEDIRVVQESVRAMGENRDDRNFAVLREMAKSDQRPEVRAAAYESLGRYESMPTNDLVHALEGEKSAEVRAGAAHALRLKADQLREKTDRAAMQALYRALSDPDPDVRVRAISGIKEVIYLNFPYNARKEPSEQRQVINQIREYLVRNGWI